MHFRTRWVCVCFCVFFLLCKYLGVDFLGYMLGVCLIIRAYRALFRGEYRHTLPPTMLECPVSSTCLLTFCAINLFFPFTYSNGVYFTVVLIGISEINDAEYLCVYEHLDIFLMENVSLNIWHIYSICSCEFF